MLESHVSNSLPEKELTIAYARLIHQYCLAHGDTQGALITKLTKSEKTALFKGCYENLSLQRIEQVIYSLGIIGSAQI